MTLEEFSRKSAKKYLQNIVLVDDEIYGNSSDSPNDVDDIPSPMRSQFNVPSAQVEKQSTDEEPQKEEYRYHPKQLVENFAKEGMVCALYEPLENFSIDKNSTIFNLCDRADVVIFDWDLFNEDGRNILPLICNLVNDSLNSVPHQVRLFIIYTGKPELERVYNSIDDHLKNGRGIESQKEQLTLKACSTRIVVRGKPMITGRTESDRQFIIEEEELAEFVIDEFAKMNLGLLPSYALHGMSAIRRNSKKILDKFHADMDGPFLLHRALCLEDVDAFDQLPELLSEEVLAVIMDEQISTEEIQQISKDTALTLNMNKDKINLNGKDGTTLDVNQKLEYAQKYLGEGISVVEDKIAKLKDKHIQDFHIAMKCSETYAEKKLAELFSIRTRYLGSILPALELGTIVRCKKVDAPFVYSLCLMPICDSMRLTSRTSFPFWTLEEELKDDPPLRIVVPTKEKEKPYIELCVCGKSRDKLWLDNFEPGPRKVVSAVREEGNFLFKGTTTHQLEWVAQLKPSHAQRIAHYIGQSISRVGVIEAEWLRTRTK